MEKEPTIAEIINQTDEGHSSDSELETLSQEEDVQRQQKSPNLNTNNTSETLQEQKLPTKPPKSEHPAKTNNQSSASKHQKKGEKATEILKPQTEALKVKKTHLKKEFPDEPIKQKKPKNQRQQNPKPKKKVQKQERPKQTETKEKIFGYDQEWTENNIDSDNEEGEKYLKQEEQRNENQQLTAFVEDEEIQNLTMTHENLQLNNPYLQKEVSLKYEHWVENKHLLVLYLLFRRQIYDQFPKKQFNRIDIHPSNKNKIRIFGTSNQEIKEVSAKISELINKIAIVKLNIRHDEATRLKSSKLLSDRLLKDKMVIFKYGNNSQKSYYLGGKGSQPQLSAVFKDIRNLKFKYFRMFDYKNTRSYSIILGHLIRQKEFLKAFLKWSVKYIQIVPFIPNFSHGPKRDKERSLCFLMTTVGSVENFSPKEIELTMAPFIKNTFFSIALIFKKGEPYLPKMQLENIHFRYVFEKKLAWAYVYIMCTKKQFFAKRKEIISEIEKLAEKNVIFGTRFFDNIAPERSQYIKPDIYKEIPYPENEPYSSSIIARRIGSEEAEMKKEENKNEKVEMKEKDQRVWHKFDWKEYLMNIKSSEVAFGEEIKK